MVVFTAWEFSFPDNHFTLYLALLACWAILSIGWAIYVIAMSILKRSVRWLRWPDLIVGIAALFALVIALTPAPFEARFRISQSAMNADATKIMNDPKLAKSTDHIGRWPAESVQAYRGGMRFLIPDIGFLDPVGFAYSINGEPPNLGGEDIYYQQSDRWWIWQESW
ncbi:MAG: hypothetical protein JHC87_07650 [Thermoleophilaceae bacterium]|nr:hypothetical protein [Thermoleophilaceae bacterium]